MNIFILDYDIVKCAEYHVNKHTIKMILETTQLLNNALIKNDASYVPVYKATHQNHPSSIWTSASISNFDWLARLGIALCEEYTYRYNKVHKCHSIIEALKNNSSRSMLKSNGLTAFALCMPDQYKVSDPVQSYRNYYRADKAYIAKWKNRNIPEWWNND